MIELTFDERVTTGGRINLLFGFLASIIVFCVLVAPAIVLVLRAVNVDMSSFHLSGTETASQDVFYYVILFIALLFYFGFCAVQFDGYAGIRRSQRRGRPGRS